MKNYFARIYTKSGGIFKINCEAKNLQEAEDHFASSIRRGDYKDFIQGEKWELSGIFVEREGIEWNDTADAFYQHKISRNELNKEIFTELKSAGIPDKEMKRIFGMDTVSFYRFKEEIDFETKKYDLRKGKTPKSTSESKNTVISLPAPTPQPEPPAVVAPTPMQQVELFDITDEHSTLEEKLRARVLGLTHVINDLQALIESERQEADTKIVTLQKQISDLMQTSDEERPSQAMKAMEVMIDELNQQSARMNQELLNKTNEIHRLQVELEQAQHATPGLPAASDSKELEKAKLKIDSYRKVVQGLFVIANLDDE